MSNQKQAGIRSITIPANKNMITALYDALEAEVRKAVLEGRLTDPSNPDGDDIIFATPYEIVDGAKIKVYFIRVVLFKGGYYSWTLKTNGIYDNDAIKSTVVSCYGMLEKEALLSTVKKKQKRIEELQAEIEKLEKEINI